MLTAKNRTCRSRGLFAFSLVELLVVIGIITVLAGLLLPALQRAKFVAYVASCTSNLRQTSIGLGLYTGDYDRWYPSDEKITVGSFKKINAYTCDGGLKDYVDPLDCTQMLMNGDHGHDSWRRKNGPTFSYSIYSNNMTGCSQRSSVSPTGAANPERVMRRVGERWKMDASFGIDDLTFNLLAADITNNYGSYNAVSTNHMPSWNVASGGYGPLKTITKEDFISNYAFDDGAVRSHRNHYLNIQNNMNKRGITGFADNDGYLVPTERGK